MNIIKSTLKFNALYKRAKTIYLILHHRAGNGDIESLHEDHLKKKYAGCGYQFYIRKDGSICEGRPIDVSGAHTVDYNSISIGVCFEGNFEFEKPTDAQIKSGLELVSYIKSIYPSIIVDQHKKFQATACAGKNFPINLFNKEVFAIAKEEPHWAEEDYNELKASGLRIDEKRFNDKLTRGELFAMMNKFRKTYIK